MPSDKAKTIPAVVVPLVLGRTKFATLWKDGAKYGRDTWIAAVANELAAKGFNERTIAASIHGNADMATTEEEADEFARSAVSGRVKETEAAVVKINVKIIRWYRQAPAIYDVKVNDTMLTATGPQIGTRMQLYLRCLEYGAVAHLPPPKDYPAWLEEQLNAAEVVDQPAEASEEGAQLEYVTELLDATGYCEDLALMSHITYYVHDHHKHILASRMFRDKAQGEWPSMSRQDFYRHVRSIGWRAHTLRIGDVTMRTWRLPHTGALPPSAREISDAAREKRINAAAERKRQQAFDEMEDRPFDFEDREYEED